ncbi:MAG: hypothetical protein ACKORB_10135 [Opitutia bacterium]
MANGEGFSAAKAGVIASSTGSASETPAARSRARRSRRMPVVMVTFFMALTC